MQEKLRLAKTGDINAYHELFSGFQKELKAFIYRLVADRSDADDLTHDSFIKSFSKIRTFNEKSSLKTWVFSIASNLCLDFLRKRNRWSVYSQDKSRAFAETNMDVEEALIRTNKYSLNGVYEIKEHIDFCFTCMTKTLPLEQQITLILKDIYGFTVTEIAEIISRSPGVVKHLLHDARKTMMVIFDDRCALISKKGVCHQCSELNGYFNPKQKTQEELMKMQLVKEAGVLDIEQLYFLRANLVSNINPLTSRGTNLHEVFMQITRKVEGEISKIDY
ncbi:MAG: RNA polymerase sigma factor [Chitinophagales bacterium]|nr:RNA polymerase sigma factor [Chitinophagales bacterium]